MNEATYECDRCRIKPVKESYDKVNIELLKIDETADGTRGTMILNGEFECNDLEIFLMNNEGKTFDRKIYKKEVYGSN